MSEFVYLYRRPPRPADESPQQMQDRMQRWRAWFADLEKRGHIKSIGQPLAQTGGGVVRGKGKVSDGWGIVSQRRSPQTPRPAS